MRVIGIIIVGCLSATLTTAVIYGLWVAAVIKDPALPVASLDWSITIGIGLAVRGVFMRLVD